MFCFYFIKIIVFEIVTVVHKTNQKRLSSISKKNQGIKMLRFFQNQKKIK